MSTFSQNLPLLRRRAGYTQESLAEALGVSRQAVGKWESGQTLPEAATLLTLAELLDCSLDQLMRLPLTEEEATPQPKEDASPEDDPSSPPPDGDEDAALALWQAYDRHMNQFALMISSGVTLILMGVAALLALLALTRLNALAVLPLLLCVAAAVFLFIWAGTRHEDFQRLHPVIPDRRDPEEAERFRRLFGLGMAFAVAAIVADVALLVGLLILANRVGWMPVLLPAALFFLILGGAVGTIILLGILQEKYDLDSWTREAVRSSRLEEKLERQVEDALDRALDDDPDGRWSGVIMLIATGIFLVAGFLFDAWHPAWVVFPLGGILCAIVQKLERKS